MSARKITVGTDRGSFDIVTTSPRRYLVIDTVTRSIVKRTDNRIVADREARKWSRTKVVDTKEVQVQ